MTDILGIFRQYGVPFNDPCNEDYIGVCHCPGTIVNLDTIVVNTPLNICGSVYTTGTTLADVLAAMCEVEGNPDADWFQSGLISPPSDINQGIYTNGFVGFNKQIPEYTIDILDGGNISFNWEVGNDTLFQIGTKGSPVSYIHMYDSNDLKISFEPGASNYMRDIVNLQLGNQLTPTLGGTQYLLSIDGNLFLGGEIIDSNGNLGSIGQYLTPTVGSKNTWTDLPVIQASNGLTLLTDYELGGTITKFTHVENIDNTLTIGDILSPSSTAIIQDAFVNTTSIRSTLNTNENISKVLVRPEFVDISSQDLNGMFSITVSGDRIQIKGLPEFIDEATAIADITLLSDSLYRVTGDSNLKIK